MNEITVLIAVIGVIAFLVSVITQVTKEIGIFKKIHTPLQVTVLSIMLTVTAYFAYISYSGIVVSWYMIIGSVICGFIVAFVAMFGWEKLCELYHRFKKKE